MKLTNAVIRAIDNRRIILGQSMTECARDIGVTFDTYWNALNRPAKKMRDFNEAKYRRYYLAHESEIAPFLDAEAAKVEGGQP